MPRFAKALLAALVPGLLLLGCPHRAPAPPLPPAPALQIPPGCEANLSGRYQHARDPAFVYDGVDDGGTLLLALHRTDAPPSDAGWASTEILLTRTGHGFQGMTRTTAFNALEKPCAVELPTQLTACADGGLTLRSAETIAIGPACEPSAAPAALVDQRLVRVGAAMDAGR